MARDARWLEEQLKKALELLRESRFGAARRPSYEDDVRAFLSYHTVGIGKKEA